ncbi:hypothetical protein BDP81DRAFT_426687 [Colletotrichum phormii]|uniref:Uncharacterized protein n=1 Tax=Colletotrichum phormii TaxID=359342 RepID=A0AAI9ZS00_9PEZI|nr:uncharacterized protein BDP81DRAFT_426687 [Colletotrichum phormii]KAK1637122.1 hypothetical protein BDP81DRAFT_426687 [Colletotrichum phormii]
MMSPRPSVMSYPPSFSAAPLPVLLLSPKELPPSRASPSPSTRVISVAKLALPTQRCPPPPPKARFSVPAQPPFQSLLPKSHP